MKNFFSIFLIVFALVIYFCPEGLACPRGQIMTDAGCTKGGRAEWLKKDKNFIISVLNSVFREEKKKRPELSHLLKDTSQPPHEKASELLNQLGRAEFQKYMRNPTKRNVFAEETGINHFVKTGELPEENEIEPKEKYAAEIKELHRMTGDAMYEAVLESKKAERERHLKSPIEREIKGLKGEVDQKRAEYDDTYDELETFRNKQYEEMKEKKNPETGLPSIMLTDLGGPLGKTKNTLNNAANVIDDVMRTLEHSPNIDKSKLYDAMDQVGFDPEKTVRNLRGTADQIRPMNTGGLRATKKLMEQRIEELQREIDAILSTVASEKKEMDRLNAEIANVDREMEMHDRNRLKHIGKAEGYDQECANDWWTCTWNLPKAAWERAMAGKDDLHKGIADSWRDILIFQAIWPTIRYRIAEFQTSPHQSAKSSIEGQLGTMDQTISNLENAIEEEYTRIRKTQRDARQAFYDKARDQGDAITKTEKTIVKKENKLKEIEAKALEYEKKSLLLMGKANTYATMVEKIEKGDHSSGQSARLLLVGQIPAPDLDKKFNDEIAKKEEEQSNLQAEMNREKPENQAIEQEKQAKQEQQIQAQEKLAAEKSLNKQSEKELSEKAFQEMKRASESQKIVRGPRSKSDSQAEKKRLKKEHDSKKYAVKGTQQRVTSAEQSLQDAKRRQRNDRFLTADHRTAISRSGDLSKMKSQFKKIAHTKGLIKNSLQEAAHEKDAKRTEKMEYALRALEQEERILLAAIREQEANEVLTQKRDAGKRKQDLGRRPQTHSHELPAPKPPPNQEQDLPFAGKECNPYIPKRSQSGCIEKMEERQADRTGQPCNPDVPKYAQKGCIEVVQEKKQADTVGKPCNPDVPSYAQPGCIK